MLRDITLGQYYQTDSVIHRLDPRVKLVTTIVFIVSLFVVEGAAGYALAGLFLLLVSRLSQVPGSFTHLTLPTTLRVASSVFVV